MPLIAIVFLTACQNVEPIFDPASGAEFRFWASSFAELKDPVCPLTEKQIYLKDFSQLDEHWEKLKDELTETSFGMDIAIVESDEAYKRSQAGVVECFAPDLPGSNREIGVIYNSMFDALQNMQSVVDRKAKES